MFYLQADHILTEKRYQGYGSSDRRAQRRWENNLRLETSEEITMAKPPVRTRRQNFIRSIITAGSIAGALVAMATAWHLFGGPVPAWSSDLQKLDRKQTEIAAELYGNRVRSLLAVAPPTDPIARQNWDEEIRRARQQLDNAEQRRIELSK